MGSDSSGHSTGTTGLSPGTHKIRPGVEPNGVLLWGLDPQRKPLVCVAAESQPRVTSTRTDGASSVVFGCGMMPHGRRGSIRNEAAAETDWQHSPRCFPEQPPFEEPRCSRLVRAGQGLRHKGLSRDTAPVRQGSSQGGAGGWRGQPGMHMAEHHQGLNDHEPSRRLQ
jgi:hypothetical protein